MTTRLKLYKAALRSIGENTIATLDEDREPRRLLDEVWDDGGVKACLEVGQWKFAMRTVRLDFDPDITPDFGYQKAFLKPSDWCVTSAVSDEEYFYLPLTRYVDEAGYWFCDYDSIYVRYISNDSEWGEDLSNWPERFSDFVASHFGRKIVYRLTSDKEREVIAKEDEKKAKRLAKNVDAMGDPTKFPVSGNWTRSRQWGQRERGNRNKLIG